MLVLLPALCRCSCWHIGLCLLALLVTVVPNSCIFFKVDWCNAVLENRRKLRKASQLFYSIWRGSRYRVHKLEHVELSDFPYFLPPKLFLSSFFIISAIRWDFSFLWDVCACNPWTSSEGHRRNWFLYSCLPLCVTPWWPPDHSSFLNISLLCWGNYNPSPPRQRNKNMRILPKSSGKYLQYY